MNVYSQNLASALKPSVRNKTYDILHLFICNQWQGGLVVLNLLVQQFANCCNFNLIKNDISYHIFSRL